jgi:hypothetical protein
MATNAYITNRRTQYGRQRPQGMLWADNPGDSVNGLYVPRGLEVGQTTPSNPTDQDLLNEFLILSDDNRSPLQFGTVRIEKKERMINGRMRSYHVADKLEISTSWSRLPSRSFSNFPGFDEFGTPSLRESGNRDPGNDGSFDIVPNITNFSEQYTTDAGAGGVEILDWYNSYKGSFWVYLAYDKYTNFSIDDEERYSRLGQYNEVLEMYISNLTYSVEKRGGSNHDLWNISVSLEEA